MVAGKSRLSAPSAPQWGGPVTNQQARKSQLSAWPSQMLPWWYVGALITVSQGWRTPRCLAFPSEGGVVVLSVEFSYNREVITLKFSISLGGPIS